MFAHVTGMFVFGVAALLAVSYLYQRRLSEPFPAAAAAARPSARHEVGTSGAPPGRTAPTALALDSIDADLRTFVAAIHEGQRMQAMQVLDGAFRVADVLRSAAPSERIAGELFAQIERIRRAVQNNDIDGAIEASGAAAPATRRTRLDAASRMPRHLEDYVGAIVITSAGEPAGTVAAVEDGELKVARGGGGRLLGLIDMPGGATYRVGADAVVFGAVHSFRMTMVVDTTR